MVEQSQCWRSTMSVLGRTGPEAKGGGSQQLGLRQTASARPEWSTRCALSYGMNRPGFRRHLAAINYGLGGGGYEHEALYG